MKTTSIIAILCLAIGFASGWLLKPNENGLETAKSSNERPTSRATSTSSTRGSSDRDSRPASRTSVTATRTEDIESEVQKSIDESQKTQSDMMRKRVSDRFDMQIAAMVKKLGLNADQEKSLRAFYATQLAKIDLSVICVVASIIK